MEQLARAAGVARTPSTAGSPPVRHSWTNSSAGPPASSPTPSTPPARTPPSPLVALYQVTVNVLRVKSDWSFAMNRAVEDAHPEAARIHAEVRATCVRLFHRAKRRACSAPTSTSTGPGASTYALIHEAAKEGAEGGDADALATRVVDTLLREPGFRPDSLWNGAAARHRGRGRHITDTNRQITPGLRTELFPCLRFAS